MTAAPDPPDVQQPPAELRSRNPATGAVLGTVAATPLEDVQELVAGARKVQPLWALLRMTDRARYMRRVAQAIIDEFDELAQLIAREQGRPRAEIATLELLPAIDALIWIADEGARVLGPRRVPIHRSQAALGKRARVAYEPYGVIGVIGAGSAPLAQPLGQIAGALLAGNGVVFKPARRACLAGERIARLLARATLPEGLVRVAHGGAQVGVALARSPVDKVLFTGSPAVGRAVARACVSQDKEVTVELGGKDAMLVLADADLPRAAAGALWAGCAGAGQARGSVERIYVASRGRRALSHRPGQRRAGAARRRPRAPRRADRPAGLARDAWSTCGSSSTRPSPRAPGCTAADRSPSHRRAATADAPFYASGGAQRGHPRDADHARAARRPRAGGDGGRLDRPRDRAGQRLRLRPRRLDLDRRPPPRRCASRASCDAGMVWLNDHLPGPMLARGPWGAAAGGGLGRTLGRGRPAGLRPGEAHHLGPPGTRGLWWAPYDELLEQAARTVARLRSARDSDRERAWRHGVGALAAGRGPRGRRGPLAPAALRS